MVNKDMNGFPVKKCSAFQFFKKRVRRWIKKPSASVEKVQSKHLKYTPVSAVTHITTTEEENQHTLCQSCLGDHAFESYVGPLGQQVDCSKCQTSSGTVHQESSSNSQRSPTCILLSSPESLPAPASMRTLEPCYV